MIEAGPARGSAHSETSNAFPRTSPLLSFTVSSTWYDRIPARRLPIDEDVYDGRGAPDRFDAGAVTPT
jgi:hypothetical protein